MTSVAKRNIVLFFMLLGLPFVGLGIVKSTSSAMYQEGEGDYRRKLVYSPADIVTQGQDVMDFMSSNTPAEVVEKYSERHQVTKEYAENHLKAKARIFLSDAEITAIENMGTDEAIGFMKTKAMDYLANNKERF